MPFKSTDERSDAETLQHLAILSVVVYKAEFSLSLEKWSRKHEQP